MIEGERIAILETKVDGLTKMSEAIMTNHIPHIQARLDLIDNKLSRWGGVIAVLAAAAPFIADFILK